MATIPPAGIEGDLEWPSSRPPVAVIVFAHGSGSSRFSRRNRQVAQSLNQAGFATLLMDLLTPDEDQIRENRFDIPLLAERLRDATRWLAAHPEAGTLPVGYFGASTGAAAALVAAAGHSDIFAVVSRGGRPDLAGSAALRRVQSPTLLIVGGDDEAVIPLNESALRELGGLAELVIVPGATHLFEEPGTLEEVTRLATEWFERYRPGASSPGQ